MNSRRGSIFLIAAALIWGTGFVMQILGMSHNGPFTFNGIRMLLGCLVLIPVIKRFSKKDPQPSVSTKQMILGGLFCGLALYLGASLQQYGMQYTTAGKAGFITALYMVIVTILRRLLGHTIKAHITISVLIASVGLFLLSTKSNEFYLQKGDFIVLIGSFFWAVHILVIDYFVQKIDPIKLSAMQFFVAGTLASITALIFEDISLHNIVQDAFPILYAAILVVGVAYTLQIVGQKSVEPTLASILLSLESVFAVISGSLFLHERMNSREVIGCLLMFIAILLSQGIFQKQKIKKSSHQ